MEGRPGQFKFVRPNFKFYFVDLINVGCLFFLQDVCKNYVLFITRVKKNTVLTFVTKIVKDSVESSEQIQLKKIEVEIKKKNIYLN